MSLTAIILNIQGYKYYSKQVEITVFTALFSGYNPGCHWHLASSPHLSVLSSPVLVDLCGCGVHNIRNVHMDARIVASIAATEHDGVVDSLVIAIHIGVQTIKVINIMVVFIMLMMIIITQQFASHNGSCVGPRKGDDPHSMVRVMTHLMARPGLVDMVKISEAAGNFRDHLPSLLVYLPLSLPLHRRRV